MDSADKIGIYKELQQELEERKKLQKYFYQEDFITIEYDSRNNWIYSDWKGYQTEGSVKAGCEKMLEALVHFNTTKVLNDNTHVVGIWTPAAQWVGCDWFPRMEKAGLRYFAWVYSPSAFSQVSTNESLKHASPGSASIATFYTIASGQEWLSSQKLPEED